MRRSRRLGGHVAAHRTGFLAVTPEGMVMTTVRIAHAEPRPGNLGNGSFLTQGWLVVLADDAAHRALPIWLNDPGDGSLSQLLEFRDRPAGEIVTAGVPEELTARLMSAADAGVTGVDIEVTAADIGELSAEVSTARIGVGGPAGARQVTARLGLGLAMAAAAGAPVRVADAVLDRLAVPVPGDDLLGPFLDRVPPASYRLVRRRPPSAASVPRKRPRFEPRNMAFADGLDRWDLDRGFLGAADEPHRQDYSPSAEGQSAVLSAAVPQPAGSAALIQTIFADDYRGATVVFRGEIRTAADTEGGLRLEIFAERWRWGAREQHGVTVTGRSDWTRHEITALIPGDADRLRFGIALTGPGRVELRNAELHTAEPAHGA
jgi:hypothetical protein